MSRHIGSNSFHGPTRFARVLLVLFGVAIGGRAWAQAAGEDDCKHRDKNGNCRSVFNTPKKPRQRIIIHSRPAGATVIIDGAEQPGTTPLELPRALAPGKHMLVVRLSEYVEDTQTITVEQHGTQRFDAFLVRYPVLEMRLLDADQSGLVASLAVDGQVRGQLPVEAMVLEPGMHEIEVTSPGYAPFTIRQDFQAGNTYQLLPQLTLLAGSIEIATDVAGLDVFLVPLSECAGAVRGLENKPSRLGDFQGKTPADGVMAIENLAPERHCVEIHVPKVGVARQELSVSPGKATVYEFRLADHVPEVKEQTLERGWNWKPAVAGVWERCMEVSLEDDEVPDVSSNDQEPRGFVRECEAQELSPELDEEAIQRERTMCHRKWVQRAPVHHLASECVELGWWYQQQGQDEKAVKLYDSACKLGLAEGCESLGWMLDAGRGVQMNRQQALVAHVKACDAGLKRACYRIYKKSIPEPATAYRILKPEWPQGSPWQFSAQVGLFASLSPFQRNRSVVSGTIVSGGVAYYLADRPMSLHALFGISAPGLVSSQVRDAMTNEYRWIASANFSVSLGGKITWKKYSLRGAVTADGRVDGQCTDDYNRRGNYIFIGVGNLEFGIRSIKLPDTAMFSGDGDCTHVTYRTHWMPSASLSFDLSSWILRNRFSWLM